MESRCPITDVGHRSHGEIERDLNANILEVGKVKNEVKKIWSVITWTTGAVAGIGLIGGPLVTIWLMHVFKP